jgi:hypothetical protein
MYVEFLFYRRIFCRINLGLCPSRRRHSGFGASAIAKAEVAKACYEHSRRNAKFAKQFFRCSLRFLCDLSVFALKGVHFVCISVDSRGGIF